MVEKVTITYCAVVGGKEIGGEENVVRYRVSVVGEGFPRGTFVDTYIGARSLASAAEGCRTLVNGLESQFQFVNRQTISDASQRPLTQREEEHFLKLLKGR